MPDENKKILMTIAEWQGYSKASFESILKSIDRVETKVDNNMKEIREIVAINSEAIRKAYNEINNNKLSIASLKGDVKKIGALMAFVVSAITTAIVSLIKKFIGG